MVDTTTLMMPGVDHSLSSRNHLFQLARSGKRLPHILLAIVMTPVFLIGGSLVGGIPLAVILVAIGRVQEALVDSSALPPLESGLLGALVTVLAISGIYIVIWLWVRLYEKRPFRTIGLERHAALVRVIRGAILGVLFMSVTVGILAALGMVTNANIQPERVGLAALGGVLLMGIGFLVQGPGEEVLYRGWQMGAVGGRYGIWAGVLLSSVLFAISHGLNPGVGILPIANIFLTGIFLAFFALREGSIWGACAWHWTWNWAQGNLFGLLVSGTSPRGGSLLGLQTSGPELITGGAFGPEGGLVVTGVIVAGIVVLYFIGAGRAVKNRSNELQATTTAQGQPSLTREN